MASATRTRQRGEQRRLSIRTLAIASAASATAAIVTSQFWKGGTPVAAAVTPVIVALVSELLHRPTEKIAERFTSNSTAVLPGETEAPPDPDVYRPPPGAPSEPQPAGEAPVRVYRPRRAKRNIAVGVVVATAVLAFAIAASAITLPELITGGSIGGGDRPTLLGGGNRDKGAEEEETPTQTETVPGETRTVPGETRTETVPAEPQSPQAAPRQQQQPRTQTQTTPTPTTTTPQPR
jgi:hypothetical protein